jgi:predicted dehydrogenase
MSPRIALVGYGSAGRGIHAPLLRTVGCSPAVVVTAHAERVRQVHVDLPDATVVSDLDEALELRPDLAVLASPSGVHAAQVLACVAAGVPVVVDKPLAVDAAQARGAVEAARAAGVALTVFQNRRWDTENLTLAGLLAEGTLGEVHRFERRWERWRPVPKDRWRENSPPVLGGGILLDLHSHLIDSAVQFFGPVVQVYAETAAWTTPAEDDAFVSLLHAGGVRSHLGASSVAGAPGPRTRVLGSAGAYVVTRFEGEPAAFGSFEDAPGHCGWLVGGQDREPVPATPGGHADFYRTVFAALQEEGPARQQAMPVDPWDAVHVLEVIDAARVCAAHGRVVTLSVGQPG